MSIYNPTFERPEDSLVHCRIEELEIDEFLPAERLESLDGDPNNPVDVPAVAEDEIALDTAVDDPAQAVDPLTLNLALARATEAATERRHKITPSPWQLSVASELYLGRRDVLLLGGTRELGKTLSCVMPCFLRPKTIIWILTPASYVAMEEAESFGDWGLKAVGVNLAEHQPRLLKNIRKGKYQVVVLDIESIAALDKLKTALRSRKLKEKRSHVLVVDWAHSVADWTTSGVRHPLYRAVGKLRSMLPRGTPLLSATPTAGRGDQENIRRLIPFRPRPFTVNLEPIPADLVREGRQLPGGEGFMGDLPLNFPWRAEPRYTVIHLNHDVLN
ncbi:hypothetical protein FRC09_009185 [Ceratobasidium sp. 395]|nr:hypothetical protein FRC09_009185 [Ceratobasidium sp. 395]